MPEILSFRLRCSALNLTTRIKLWIVRCIYGGPRCRDVLTDAKAVFGDMKFTPVQLAIASDTDNAGETARAGFADLH